jgi:hypothetical protein
MAKASLTLPNGTTIQIDGKQDELEVLLKVFVLNANDAQSDKVQTSLEKTKKRMKAKTKSPSTKGSRAKKGPMAFIKELKGKGYFTKQKRSLNDVKEQLNTNGHFFPSEALGVTLLRLVKKGELRRLKEDKKWTYTTSD